MDEEQMLRTVGALVSEADERILTAYLCFTGDDSILEDIRAIDSMLIALDRKLRRVVRRLGNAVVCAKLEEMEKRQRQEG